MKVLVLAGVLTAAAIPLAGAAEAAADCQLDEQGRRSQVRIDSGGAGGSAPAAPARASATSREGGVAEHTAQRETETPRQTAERRRNGRRIPDAELIGPRGAL